MGGSHCEPDGGSALRRRRGWTADGVVVELAGRRAYFSAREEFIQALRTLSQAMDVQHGTNAHSAALAAGMRALEEAKDFVPRGAGHFELDVVSEAFAGLSRVKQQQLVYGAIAPLLSGDAAPVHAIDRMVTRTP